MNQTSYEHAVKHAAAYREIGETDIYLPYDAKSYPWHLATSCEQGCSVRFGTYVDIRFLANDPETGLTFRWSFDLEDRNSNGTSHLRVRSKEIRRVMAELPPKVREQFRERLRGVAGKIEEQADEYQDTADKLRGHCRDIWSLIANGE